MKLQKINLQKNNKHLRNNNYKYLRIRNNKLKLL